MDTAPADMGMAPADGLIAASWLLIALPLAGAAVLLLGGRRTDRWGHLLGTGTVVAAFVLGLLCALQLGGRRVDVELFTFVATGSLDVEAGLLFDPLSALFVLLITGVGALIHVYSIGYMAHDPRRRRGRHRPRDHHVDLPDAPVGVGRRRQPAQVLRTGNR